MHHFGVAVIDTPTARSVAVKNETHTHESECVWVFSLIKRRVL